MSTSVPIDTRDHDLEIARGKAKKYAAEAADRRVESRRSSLEADGLRDKLAEREARIVELEERIGHRTPGLCERCAEREDRCSELEDRCAELQSILTDHIGALRRLNQKGAK